MRFFQASFSSAFAFFAVAAFGSTAINIQEFHNPKFHTPIHDIEGKHFESVQES
jgi:hypothetical protein